MKVRSPEYNGTQTMICECVMTYGVVCPLNPEHKLPSHLGLISPCWAQIYLTGIQHHEKKYTGTMQQIAWHRKRVITLLRSWGSATEKQAGEWVEGEGWIVIWALDDPDEHPLPSSLVARCDMTEVLVLVRGVTATKCKWIFFLRVAERASLAGGRMTSCTRNVLS